MKELINKKISKKLLKKREDEDRDLMIDEVIEMRSSEHEFLDVTELKEVKREMLEFENEKEEFMMLVYLCIFSD